MNAAREQAERTADRVRAELLTTLRELDRRRHCALDVRYQVEKHFPLLAAAAAVTGVAAGVAVVFVVARSRGRRHNLFAQRVRGLMSAWEDPRRFADSEPVASMPTAARKLAMAIALTLAIQLTKRSIQRLLLANAGRLVLLYNRQGSTAGTARPHVH